MKKKMKQKREKKLDERGKGKIVIQIRQYKKRDFFTFFNRLKVYFSFFASFLFVCFLFYFIFNFKEPIWGVV